MRCSRSAPEARSSSRTGAGWRRHATNTLVDLLDVWVAAPDDIWVAAIDGSLLRYDGTTLTATGERGGNLAGTAPDDVRIGTRHFDGQQFSDRSPISVVHAVLPVGPRDAWALGLLKGPQDSVDTGGAVVMRYDGSGWTQVGERLSHPFWGGGLVKVDGEVWIDNRSEVLRHEAGRWVQVPGASNDRTWRVPQLTPPPGHIVLDDGERFRSVPEDTQCHAVIERMRRCGRPRPVRAPVSLRRFALGPHAADPFGDTLAP